MHAIKDISFIVLQANFSTTEIREHITALAVICSSYCNIGNALYRFLKKNNMQGRRKKGVQRGDMSPRKLICKRFLARKLQRWKKIIAERLTYQFFNFFMKSTSEIGKKNCSFFLNFSESIFLFSSPFTTNQNPGYVSQSIFCWSMNIFSS